MISFDSAGELSGPKRFLIKLDSTADFETLDGETKAKVKGELRLSIVEPTVGRAGLVLTDLGVVCAGLDLGREPTGRISFGARAGKGYAATAGKRSTAIKVDFQAECVYQLLIDKLGYEEVDVDSLMPHLEDFAGRITGRVETPSAKGKKRSETAFTGEVVLTYHKGGLGIIRTVRIPLRRAPLFPLDGRGPDRGDANEPCPEEHSTNRRRLRCQPVGFRSSNGDANPTGASLATQFGAANTIWGKCCIEFDVQPIQLITNATLKTSNDTGAIRDSFTDPDPNTIEVFFAGGNLPTVGGGVATSGGTALSKVVITDNNAGNPNLLAHELGHTLGGRHPGFGATPPRWDGDPGTVLVPSGSPNIPNPDENTHSNCINASNPAITTLTATCCLTHDITDHYIRDFPEDSGVEPNPGFPGRNFYSMSNVWNRLSNNAGGTNPDGTPQHEHPVRFATDGSAFQNFFFAKVEAIENLPPRDMEVKFFMKHPGSGGGAANLQLLGSVAVPDALSPASPQTISLPWTIPAGTPNHSCVFAVVRSPSEPDQDVSALSFNQVEGVIAEDNDWAQRNLDITENPDGNTLDGNAQAFWSRPIMIVYPRERGGKPLPVHIRVDARRAKGLKGLTIEIPGQDERKIAPGETLEFYSDKRLEPGAAQHLVVKAVLPGKVASGESFEVDIEPTLGKAPFRGYGFAFRTGAPKFFVEGLLDAALAAYHDTVAFAGLASANKLKDLHLTLVAKQPLAPDVVAEALTEGRDALKDLGQWLGNLSEAKRTGAPDALERLLHAIDSGAPAVAILSTHRDFVGRLHNLVYLMTRP